MLLLFSFSFGFPLFSSPPASSEKSWLVPYKTYIKCMHKSHYTTLHIYPCIINPKLTGFSYSFFYLLVALLPFLSTSVLKIQSTYKFKLRRKYYDRRKGSEMRDTFPLIWVWKFSIRNFSFFCIPRIWKWDANLMQLLANYLFLITLKFQEKLPCMHQLESTLS